MVYLPTYHKNQPSIVCKYTSPMDGIGHVSSKEKHRLVSTPLHSGRRQDDKTSV